MKTLYELVVVRRPRTDRPIVETDQPIVCSDLAFSLFSDWAASCDREQFLLLCLDSANHIIATNTVSTGSLSASLVHPREVFKAAILGNAASILLVHNHPSGSSKPSSEDGRITARLRDAGELLGIPVLDHVIIGEEDFYSFADNGWSTSRDADDARV